MGTGQDFPHPRQAGRNNSFAPSSSSLTYIFKLRDPNSIWKQLYVEVGPQENLWPDLLWSTCVVGLIQMPGNIEAFKGVASYWCFIGRQLTLQNDGYMCGVEVLHLTLQEPIPKINFISLACGWPSQILSKAFFQFSRIWGSLHNSLSSGILSLPLQKVGAETASTYRLHQQFMTPFVTNQFLYSYQL